MEKIFVLLEGKVEGPYLENDAIKKASSSPSGQLWAKGLEEWVSLEKWPSVSRKPSVKTYCFANDPFNEKTLDEVISELTKMNYKTLSSIYFYDPKLKEKKSIFEISEICSALNIPCRRIKRIDALGEAILEIDGEVIHAVINSLSADGVGLLILTKSEQIFGEVKLTLNLEGLPAKIHCHAKQLYLTNDGESGFKFERLGQENQSLIISYVRGSLQKLTA